MFPPYAIGLIFLHRALNALDTAIVTTIITTATTEACVQSRRLMAYWYTIVESTRVSVPPNSWGVV